MLIDVAPRLEEYVPASHSAHVTVDASSEYFPGGHKRQEEEAAPENFPSSHGMQSVPARSHWPNQNAASVLIKHKIGLYSPEVAPGTVEYVPASQSEHPEAEANLNVAENLPESHRVQ